LLEVYIYTYSKKENKINKETLKSRKTILFRQGVV
jgi:hypothetical protein